VAEAGAHPSVSLLCELKRKFGFHCFDFFAEPGQELVAYVVGGDRGDDVSLLSMDCYGATPGQWTTLAAINFRRSAHGA
jgi:hypothetical protein